MAVPPYTGTDFSVSTDMLTSSLQTFTHTFTASPGDPTAGIAFNIVGGTQAATVCFDNVSVTKN